VDPDERDDTADSIAAARRLAQSARLRALLVTIWPFVYPVLMVAGGWVAKSVQTESRFAAVDYRLQELDKKLDAVLLNQASDRTKQQQHLMAVGKQTAYATAAALTGEPAKIKAAKHAEGQTRAANYARLTLSEGKDPETAFLWLFVDRP
jgi:hypothetical protein